MLDAQVEFDKLQQMYKDQERNKTFNAIVYGGMGSGKTQLLRTCRPPIFVDSFDPGGSLTNRALIEQGKMYVDTRWELEDAAKPFVFELWDKEYHRRKKEEFFKQLGTYAIDSATTWAATIMNVILRKAGRPATFPFQNDYGPAMSILENAIKDFTTLPCDCILLCHNNMKTNEAEGKMLVGPLFWGKLVGRIPILFDEIYHAETKETSAGVKYHLLTRRTGNVEARTRLGADGKFDTYEEPNIMNLLKKAGMV
jgi:hypothetical protein